MAIFKCKMCGGTIEFEQGASVGVCDSCGTKQTLPKLDDDRRANLYDRANHFRRNNEFDKAMGIYEQILNEDNTDAEAYWSLVLCRYGIEYVEDPTTHKRIPTVNRAQFTSVFADENYKSAIHYADGYQREFYEDEAKAIDEIQKGILVISQKEEPFDIFICYKETDRNGRRTPDSVLANDLYYQLTQEGFKVFFARITLEDKLGTAYEPYIFAALNSAKVMIVLGTKPEHFNAVWVKNEWSRYLALIKTDAKKMLIPAYKDMDPYDLPEEFSHLQAQDMGKLGFMQDLLRGIKKIVQTDEQKPYAATETVVISGNATTASLLKRAFIFLEDGDWNSANEYCEKVLDINPENAQAYLGKLLAELRVRKQEDLKDHKEPFDNRNNYQKAVRFADNELKSVLTGYINHITTRNEHARLDDIYSRAVSAMSVANTENAYKEAARLFETISEYLDSSTLAEECYNEAEIARKDAILADGKSKMTGESISNYESAIKLFESISGWEDADEKIYSCQNKIEEIKAKEETARLERERKEEERRIAAEKSVKKLKRIAVIVTTAICAIIAFVILLNAVIIPNSKYNNAIALMNEEKYEEAISAFEALNGYKDSAAKIEDCKTGIRDNKYNDAVALMETGKYEEALKMFSELGSYRESQDMAKAAQFEIASQYMDLSDYNAAINILLQLGDYKTSEELLNDAYYNLAIEDISVDNYVHAIEILSGLQDYKDSEELLTEARYVQALKDLENGSYESSISYFKLISGYKDADSLCKSAENEVQYIQAVQEESNSIILALDMYNQLPDDFKDVRDRIDILNKMASYLGLYEIKNHVVANEYISFEIEKIYYSDGTYQMSLRHSANDRYGWIKNASYPLVLQTEGQYAGKYTSRAYYCGVTYTWVFNGNGSINLISDYPESIDSHYASQKE